MTARLVQGGFEPEFRQVMANLQTVLRSAGLELSDVVSVTAYLADMGSTWLSSAASSTQQASSVSG